MLIGGLLSLCNIYSGLKIGWSSNMSVTAALLGFALWKALTPVLGGKAFTILENNLNQTAASSAASISSAGLVAAVPALTLLTGRELGWPLLALWTFSVCCVGITVAIGLRRQLIVVEGLPFPGGIAAAETLKEIYAAGKEAAARVWVLVGAGGLAASVKVLEHVAKLPKLWLPGSYAGKTGPIALGNLTLALEPSLLMVGVGGLIGLRAGVTMLGGAVVAYGLVAPYALAQSWAQPGKATDLWFGPLNKWLLWPGVALMVTSSLTSFAFSWKSIALSLRRNTGTGIAAAAASPEDDGEVSRRWFVVGLMAALVLSVALQWWLFAIGAGVAIVGVLLSFVMAMVAARVAGETNVTPVGAMGKITQLVFGVISPGHVTPNLMAANVTGGAASQCADLMHDLRTGYLLGALARYQVVAQFCGALAGATIGSAAYLLFLPDPKTQLFTDAWPAPAVATWKAVAEVFAQGLGAMPPGTQTAALVGGLAGVVLALADKWAPSRLKALLPSASALGLAFVIPAHNSIHMFFGAALAAFFGRHLSSWSARFAVVMFSGFIAGEGLAGAGVAIEGLLFD
jgi:putative OPT family oligopeptide transporter